MKFFTKRILPLLLAALTILSSTALTFEAEAYSTGYSNTHTNTGNQRADIAAVAKTQVGYTESSDGTKYGAWYKSYLGSSYNYTTAPWCAIFVMWCANQAGASAAVKGMSASSTSMLNSYKAGKNGNTAYSFSSGYSPRQGDIIFCGYSGSNSVNHVGLVVDVDSDYIYTVEGNSNNMVRNVKYSRSSGKRINGSKYILYFGVPAYTNDTAAYVAPQPEVVTDPSDAVTVNYTTTVTASSLNVRSSASSSAGVNKVLYSGTSVSIVKEAKAGGHLWGKLSDGSGWICLYYCKCGDQGQSSSTVTGETVILTGTVNATTLNVRASASSSAAISSTLKKGNTVYVVEKKTVSGSEWGRLAAGGWVSLKYITVTGSGSSSSESTSEAKQETPSSSNNSVGLQGTITASSLNVRSSAPSGSVSGTVSKGTQVTVYETRVVDGKVWGRISSGWISMTYVAVSSYQVTGDNVNVRASASTSASVEKRLSKGTVITLDQIVSDGSNVWGHISGTGWISMSYVAVKTSSEVSAPAQSGESSAPAQTTETPAASASTDAIYYGTVTANNLNVRTKAATGSVCAEMHEGDSVVVYETTTYASKVWGRTSAGWISLEFVAMEKERIVVTASSMYIRDTASTSASVRDTAKQGQHFWIDKTTKNGSSTWGHLTTGGWICMDYAEVG